MNGLIGDRFLKSFLKGFRRPSKPGFAPKAETLEKAVELTHEPHHPDGVNGTPTATRQPRHRHKRRK
jgi:hypothetical protein